jgi:hypothetical protein
MVYRKPTTRSKGQNKKPTKSLKPLGRDRHGPKQKTPKGPYGADRGPKKSKKFKKRTFSPLARGKTKIEKKKPHG